MNDQKSTNGGSVEELQPKRTIERSPPYPAINLKEAIACARTFWGHEKRNAAPAKVAYQHFGFSPKSSGGRLVLAALTKFGLLEEEGRGEDRQVKLSRLALEIILDERPVSPDRDEAIKRAALLPAIHAALWKEWGAEHPSDASLRTHLIKDRAFNESAVEDFIGEYKDTISFAKLGDGDTIRGEQQEGLSSTAERFAIKQGDFVQWTVGGVGQFPEPLRVTTISDDGQWAFIEGKFSGVPMSELSRQIPSPSEVQSPRLDAKQPPQNPFYKPPMAVSPPAGSVEERTNLDEGAVVLQWPASMSPQSVEELEYWFNGLIRRARRKAGLPPEGSVAK